MIKLEWTITYLDSMSMIFGLLVPSKVSILTWLVFDKGKAILSLGLDDRIEKHERILMTLECVDLLRRRRPSE